MSSIQCVRLFGMEKLPEGDEKEPGIQYMLSVDGDCRVYVPANDISGGIKAAIESERPTPELARVVSHIVGGNMLEHLEYEQVACTSRKLNQADRDLMIFSAGWQACQHARELDL